MSNSLKNDVLFINVDGMADFYESPRMITQNEFTAEFRIEKVENIKKVLIDHGYRVKLLNPTQNADIKIPVFKSLVSNTDMDEGKIDYSIFVLKHLYDYIKEEKFTHIINFHYDGYPINFDKWDDSFLNYDCLGSATSIIDLDGHYFSLKNNREGIHLNGGFSLRSVELLKRCMDIPLEDFAKLYKMKGCTNDDLIINDYIDWKRMPIDTRIATKFSGKPNNLESFGFHGH